jgi:RNA polymerase sigma factor (sigma-70 family)
VPDSGGWWDWRQLQDEYHRTIRRYRDHFVLRDGVVAVFSRSSVVWEGEVVCVDGIELQVRALQDQELRRGRPFVRMRRYAFHALQRVDGIALGIFRYDNAHRHRGHADEHHVHRFDERGAELGATQNVGAQHVPTLGAVLDELHGWWLGRPVRTRPGLSGLGSAEQEATGLEFIDTWPAGELRRALDDALLGLDDATRRAVRARYIDGRSLRQIAESLGVDEGQVEALVASGIERLRAHFNRPRGE